MSGNKFSLYKFIIYFINYNVWNFWKWIIDSLLSKVRTTMIGVIVGLFAFLYFANELLT